MVKTNPRLKELSIDDKGNIIETVSDFIVGRDENGLIYYLPYLREYAMIVAISLHAIDGLKFETDDNVYDSATNDDDIHALVKYFLNNNIALISEIEKQIDDVIDFKKNYLIHNNYILTNKIYDILESQKKVEECRIEVAEKENKILGQQIEVNEYQINVMNHLTPEITAKLNEKYASGEFDQQQIADAVLKSYMDAGLVQPKNNAKNVLEMKGHNKKPLPKESSKRQNTIKYSKEKNKKTNK